jgi:hypothetical protein
MLVFLFQNDLFLNQRKGYANALDKSRCARPHYSRRLLLHLAIRKSELIAVFFLRARIIQRALDLASAVTTHLTAGGLARDLSEDFER